jgi:LysM repeat protein
VKSKILLVMVVVVVALLVLSAPAVASCGASWHWVRWGETLSSIGRYYGVSPWAIASANQLYNPNHIYAGQRLYIPGGTCYAPAPQPYWGGYAYRPYGYGCGSTYVVRYGDTLARVGRMYGVNAWRIAQANYLANWNYIWAGQRLYIPCW